jgi:hypothetical protein
MIFKEKLENYTEAEFLTFLSEFFHQTSGLKGRALEEYRNKLLEHFESVSEHLGRSDVIFYPEEGQEDSPEGILKTVKEWRVANNKPGFKPE